VKRLELILKNDTLTEILCSDFEYVEKVLDFRGHKHKPIETMFEQIKYRPESCSRKKYATTMIKAIICEFWRLMIEKMVDDSYVLYFPGNRIKLGIGRVNMIGKNFKLKLSEPNMGLPTVFRLIAKKSWYSYYSIEVHKSIIQKIRDNVRSGYNYRIFNID
jgi:hypothetical protein